MRNRILFIVLAASVFVGSAQHSALADGRGGGTILMLDKHTGPKWDDILLSTPSPSLTRMTEQ
ncbi:MAG: hypothetical protein KDK01_12465 [Rhodobacteraceae bacterium]|jgi:hypothetical protein|nr:hypothetical protein [Paracoccaceae bacterium]